MVAGEVMIELHNVFFEYDAYHPAFRIVSLPNSKIIDVNVLETSWFSGSSNKKNRDLVSAICITAKIGCNPRFRQLAA
jgi:hypothetical protein